MIKKVAYIDVKQTVWERVTLNPMSEGAAAEKIVEALNKYKLVSSLSNEDLNGTDAIWDSIDETQVELTPEDNNGDPTIEMFDIDDKLIWDNVNGYADET